METKRVLEDVSVLLATEACWTRGAAARDTAGIAVFSQAPEAVCWCLVGAVTRCAPSRTATVQATIALREAVNRRYGPHDELSEFNDCEHTSFEDVKSVIRDAINKIEER